MNKASAPFGSRTADCGLARLGTAELGRLCAWAKRNALTRTRHFCFLPQKRCYRLPLAAHRKILRLLLRGTARGRLRFGQQIVRDENQTSAKQFQVETVDDFAAFFPASRPDARAQHGSL